jgi:autotransporter-associated beta strand protein
MKAKTCGWLAAIAAGIAMQTASAANGTWTNDASGNWSDTLNWLNGTVADATGSMADFGAVDITGDRTVSLDTARTLSTLIFGDAGAPANHSWTLTGPAILTLGTTPSILVSNQSVTLSLPVAGAAGFTKLGNGTLNVLGTNSYTGVTLISNGVVNYLGASRSTSGGIFNVGGAGGKAVVNINTTGSVVNNGSYYSVGGNQADTTDTSVGVINLVAGTLNNGNNNNYTEIGTGGLAGNGTYGCFNLQGGTFATLGSSGIRVGAGGLGVFNQTGGTLSCSRWFAVGSQNNGNNTAGNGGIGLVNFLGGTATIASGNRILLNDKNGGVAVMNLGTEAGGTAVVSALNTTAAQGGIDFMDQGGTAGQGILNLNSGTLQLAGPMYRNNTGGYAAVNWNGGTLKAGGNMALANAANGFPAASVYNNGVVIDSQSYTVTSVLKMVQPAGNGVYPVGGTLLIASGGGSGYLGMPYVAVTNTGAGSNLMAIATLSGGVVTGVSITCPGQGYSAGDVVGFVFKGGGATTSADPFIYTLTASDLAANTSGGLTKLGTGTLSISTNNTFVGPVSIAAGTLDAKYDGALGNGNVNVAGGATLIMDSGLTNGYMSVGANLVLASTAVANLNFSGQSSINGLSLNGGATYVAPGTYGSSSSGAANVDDTHFQGSGVLEVLTTPTVSLTVELSSSVNPSVKSQSVTFTVQVTSTGGGTPTGAVTFKDGVSVLGTGTLNASGIATFTTSALSVGTHAVTAVYNSVSSGFVGQVVNLATDTWTGAVNGTWDINTTANWSLLGGAASYLDGNNALIDDSATGTTALALDTRVSPAAVTISNTTKSYSLTGNGGIAGTGSLNKLGQNTLTLNVSNSYTGATLITNGVVVFGAASANSGSGMLVVGGNVGGAVVSVETTNTLAFGGVASVGGLTGNNTDTGAAVIRQKSGTVTTSPSGSYLEIGAGGASAYGCYELSGGTLAGINSTGVRVGAQGMGSFVQTGGFFNCGRHFAVGTQTGVNNIGGTGVATFTGGAALFASGYRIIVGDKPGSSGTFNVGTEAGGTAVLTNLYNNGGNGGLELCDDVAATSGVLNLNSGTLQLGGAIFRNANSAGSFAVNFNGGTLQAGANNMSLATNVTGFAADLLPKVYSKGVVIDSLTNVCFLPTGLASASGNGFYPAAGTVSVANGGSGYLGAPLVTVSGGSGSGASAAATLANGVVTSVAITCPGENYQSGDTLNFSFNGGGASTPADSFDYSVKASDLKDNTAGGLTKIGSGRLVIQGSDAVYAGATVVSNGTLVVNSSLTGGGAVFLRGGALAGTGTVSGPVTVSANGTLSAGDNAIGTLTINNAVSLAANAVCAMKVNKDAVSRDLIQGMTSITFGGVLSVTNLSGTLAVGDSFKLFDAAAYAGSFTSVTPAAPGAGLLWDTTSLTVDGTLKIVAGSLVNLNPTNVLQGVTNGNLSLSWPADHTGWVLQAQTNAAGVGLTGNWVDVTGSSSTNQVVVPLHGDAGSVFYRLIYRQ